MFGQYNMSKTALEITAVCQESQSSNKYALEENNSQENTFNPTLQKHQTLFGWIVLITLVFIALYVMNVMEVMSSGDNFVEESRKIVNRNWAATIYLKSIFNSNGSYVDRFINGSLLENMDYLKDRQFNYTTFLGDVKTLNYYYLFNTQIPSTLQRVVNPPLVYSNTTVDIIPPSNADYYREISNNYLGVVEQYHNKFGDALVVWQEKVDKSKMNFFIRFGFMCLCAIVYSMLLGLMYVRQRRHR